MRTQASAGEMTGNIILGYFEACNKLRSFCNTKIKNNSTFRVNVLRPEVSLARNVKVFQLFSGNSDTWQSILTIEREKMIQSTPITCICTKGRVYTIMHTLHCSTCIIGSH